MLALFCVIKFFITLFLFLGGSYDNKRRNKYGKLFS